MVSIVGAGVSGLAAGITLAKSDIPVEIYEQHSAVGMGTGHNIMAIRNYGLGYDQIKKLNELGIKLQFVKPINKIIKYAPSGKKMELFSGNGPLFYAVSRAREGKDSLDLQLADMFEKEGGIIKFNSKRNLLSGDIIATRNVFSNFWAVGAEFVDVDIDPNNILFFMDNNYCPEGYLYVIPWGKNEVSIAATTYDLSCPLPILFKKFLKENKIVKNILDGATRLNGFAGTAYSNVPKTANVKGKIFVGSAAGFVDSARGFGLKYALLSGVLAGKSIVEGLDYDTLWKKEFESELVDAFARRLMLEKMTNEGYEKLILKDKLPISKYDKLPSSVKDILRDLEIGAALISWQKKYDLKKIFYS